MRISLRLVGVLLALLMAMSWAAAADSPAAAELLERARMWASRDRPDLAREALQRLARIAPEHPDGLALLAELDIRSGALVPARATIDRLRARDARHPAIARLEDLLRLEGPDKGKLREARLLVKAGRTEAAIQALGSLYPNGPPSGDLALEYWQLVAATPSGRGAAQAALARLAQQQPDNLRYRFALAEHELSLSPLNLPALRRVIEMARLPEFARKAQSAWRRAVLREDPQPQTVTLLREYLQHDANDSAVRERLDAVVAALDTRRRGAAPPAPRAVVPGRAAPDRAGADRPISASAADADTRVAVATAPIESKQPIAEPVSPDAGLARADAVVATPDPARELAATPASRAVAPGQTTLDGAGADRPVSATPADAETRVAVAGALIETAQFDAARMLLDEIVAAEPKHAQAWRMLAQLDRRQGLNERAIERLQGAAAADWSWRAERGELRPISRLALLASATEQAPPPTLQFTVADAGAARDESSAWRPYRPLAEWLDAQSPWWAGAIDWHFRSGSEGKSTFDSKELPLENSRSLGGDARLVLRVDLVHLDAGSVALADASGAGEFGSLLLCQPGCAGNMFAQRDSGVALNAAYERGALHVDLGSTPLGFAVQRPVGGVRFKGDLGEGSYTLDVSSRPVTSSLLSYAGTRDPRTGQLWGGLQLSGVRLGLSRDEGLAWGVWSSFGWHRLHGKNVQSNQRKRAMGGAYWRAINDENRVLSVGMNAMVQAFEHNAGEFTFGHGGYYSPQLYRSVSLPLSFAERVGRWSYSVRAAVSQSRSRNDSASYFPTDAALQAAAEALTPSNGVDPHYSSGTGSGRGHSLAAAFEAQLSPRLFAGARLEIERSQDYSPNRVLVYLRFAPGEAALRSVAFPPEPVIPTSEY